MSDLDKLTSLYESIFSGNIKETDTSDDSDDKDKEDTDENEETNTDNDSDDDSNDEDSTDEDSDNEDSDDSEEDSDDSEEENDDSDDDDESDSNVDGKVKALQKQYNDILVDAFTEYAPECIEDALNQSDAAFGENIETILAMALETLKSKVLADFGIETPEAGECQIAAGAMIGPDAMSAPVTIAVAEEGRKRKGCSR